MPSHLASSCPSPTEIKYLPQLSHWPHQVAFFFPASGRNRGTDGASILLRTNRHGVTNGQSDNLGLQNPVLRTPELTTSPILTWPLLLAFLGFHRLWPGRYSDLLFGLGIRAHSVSCCGRLRVVSHWAHLVVLWAWRSGSPHPPLLSDDPLHSTKLALPLLGTASCCACHALSLAPESTFCLSICPLQRSHPGTVDEVGAEAPGSDPG